METPTSMHAMSWPTLSSSEPTSTQTVEDPAQPEAVGAPRTRSWHTILDLGSLGTRAARLHLSMVEIKL